MPYTHVRKHVHARGPFAANFDLANLCRKKLLRSQAVEAPFDKSSRNEVKSSGLVLYSRDEVESSLYSGNLAE